MAEPELARRELSGAGFLLTEVGRRELSCAGFLLTEVARCELSGADFLLTEVEPCQSALHQSYCLCLSKDLPGVYGLAFASVDIDSAFAASVENAVSRNMHTGQSVRKNNMPKHSVRI